MCLSPTQPNLTCLPPVWHLRCLRVHISHPQSTSPGLSSDLRQKSPVQGPDLHSQDPRTPRCSQCQMQPLHLHPACALDNGGPADHLSTRLLPAVPLGFLGSPKNSACWKLVPASPLHICEALKDRAHCLPDWYGEREKKLVTAVDTSHRTVMGEVLCLRRSEPTYILTWTNVDSANHVKLLYVWRVDQLQVDLC